MTTPPSGISRRGFASMSPERRSEIARKGGSSPNRDPKTRSFSMDSAFAVEQARKGGLASVASKRKSLTPPE